ncbi:MAG: hypothetical protein ACT4QF_09045 [Sporichthyaceae bacterium]
MRLASNPRAASPFQVYPRSEAAPVPFAGVVDLERGDTLLAEDADGRAVASCTVGVEESHPVCR